MREFEFRAWDKKNKMMSTPVIIFGKMSDLGAFAFDDPWEFDIQSDRFIWMPFTTRKDKNGTKIFEGDILKVKTPSGVNGIFQVAFEDGCFIISRKKISNHSNLGEVYYLSEIIGNIFKNPELLK